MYRGLSRYQNFSLSVQLNISQLTKGVIRAAHEEDYFHLSGTMYNLVWIPKPPYNTRLLTGNLSEINLCSTLLFPSVGNLCKTCSLYNKNNFEVNTSLIAKWTIRIKFWKRWFRWKVYLASQIQPIFASPWLTGLSFGFDYWLCTD